MSSLVNNNEIMKICDDFIYSTKISIILIGLKGRFNRTHQHHLGSSPGSHIKKTCWKYKGDTYFAMVLPMVYFDVETRNYFVLHTVL